MRRRLLDSSLFWLAMAGAVAVVGGIFMGVGGTRTPAHKSVLSEGWFDAGIGVVALGVVMLAWALVLYLAHRHAEAEHAAHSIHRSDSPSMRWRERRLDLINHKRVGDEMFAQGISDAAAQQWTDSVLVFLRRKSFWFRRGLPPEQVERFMTTGTGTSSQRMPDRLAVLGDLIEVMQPKRVRKRRLAAAVASGLNLVGRLRIEFRAREFKLQAAPPPALDIVYAVYGMLDDPAKQNDVTGIVRGLVQDGRLSFVADNETMGGDPALNVVKMLLIEYRVAGGATGHAEIREGEHVDLP